MLGRDIVFSCRDSALFLYRDDVSIEVSMSRSRRPRQEVRCCNRYGLGWGIYVATEFGQDQESLYRNKIFLCRDRVNQGEENLCRDKVFLCCDKIFFLSR